MKKKQNNQPQLIWNRIDIPESTCKYVSTMIAYKHYVILFRSEFNTGFEEAIAWNIQTNDWEDVQQKGTKPTRRTGHTTCLYDNNKAIIYGGSETHFQTSNEAFRATITENNGLSVEWEVLETKNKGPFRTDHTAHIYENYMYVFKGGSWDEKSNRWKEGSSNKIWRLSLESLKWDECDISKSVKNNRAGYSSILYNDTVYFFFGKDEEEERLTTDILRLNPTTMKYEKIVSNHPLLTPRENCTAQEIKGKVYIFGGQEIERAVKNKCLEEVWIYDIENNTWQNTRVSGKIPSSKEPFMSVVTEDTLFVYKDISATKRGYELCYLKGVTVDNKESLEEKESVKESRTSVLEKKIRKEPVKPKKPKRK